jgi:hypothetical protein
VTYVTGTTYDANVIGIEPAIHPQTSQDLGRLPLQPPIGGLVLEPFALHGVFQHACPGTSARGSFRRYPSQLILERRRWQDEFSKARRRVALLLPAGCCANVLTGVHFGRMPVHDYVVDLPAAVNKSQSSQQSDDRAV